MYLIAVRKDYTIEEGARQGIDQTTVTKELYSILDKEHRTLREEDITNMGFIPLNFLTTIRTDYTNEVIVNEFADTNNEEFDFVFREMPEFNSGLNMPLYDAVLLSAQKAMYKCLSPDCDFGKIVVRTQCVPVGAMNLGKPFIYTTVIIDSKLKEEPYFKLQPGFKFETIENLNQRLEQHVVPVELKKKLFIVKERPSHE